MTITPKPHHSLNPLLFSAPSPLYKARPQVYWSSNNLELPHFVFISYIASILWIYGTLNIKTDDTVKKQCHPLAIASIVIHTDFIPIYVCRSYHRGITTIPKNGMLGVTELSYYFWYDIHTSFFTVWPTIALWPLPQQPWRTIALCPAETYLDSSSAAPLVLHARPHTRALAPLSEIMVG